MARQIRRVRPIARAAADPITRAIADQIERDFGAFVPPFALHAGAPPLLAACWMMLRESLVTTHVDRRRKEAVATAVSRANACSYCVDAHSAAMHALGDGAAADALASSTAIAAGDELGALLAWGAATRTREDPRLLTPPFTAAEAPELTAIACCFHYINRMAAVFLAPSPLPFGNPRVKAWTRRLIGPVLRGQLERPLVPGDALRFLPDAPRPADLAWTAGAPTLTSAFARAAAAFDAAGVAVVPAAVRALVQARVDVWGGQEMPLGGAWLDDAVAPLVEAHRPTARIALLTAFAPSRIDDAAIAALRRPHEDDAPLLSLCAWASFTTARRLATWPGAAGVGRPSPLS